MSNRNATECEVFVSNVYRQELPQGADTFFEVQKLFSATPGPPRSVLRRQQVHAAALGGGRPPRVLRRRASSRTISYSRARNTHPAPQQNAGEAIVRPMRDVAH